MTLAEVKQEWDTGPGAEFGLVLEYGETDEQQKYVALTDDDADITQQRLDIFIAALRHYPRSFLAKSKLARIRMVKGGRFTARAGGSLIVFNAVSLSIMAKITHHEMMHILESVDPVWGNRNDPHPKWINPEGFTYGSGWADKTGFVSTYAKTDYREDLADTASHLWERQSDLLPRLESDDLLRNKCRVMVEWWSRYGLTRFNALFDLPDPKDKIVVTDRIAGASRYETAVQVSKIRFPDYAEVVYLANAQDFPDALVAGTLATNGPLLLVPATGSVPQAVLAEVQRLRPDRIVAVGGTGVVSDATLDAVRAASQS